MTNIPRVLVDVLACRAGQGGILTHGRGVSEGLAGRRDVKVTLLTNDARLFRLAPTVEVVLAPRWTRSFILRALWRELRLPGIIRRSRSQVVLSTVPELPLRCLGVPSALVVHDVAPLVAPALYPLAKRLRFRLLLPPALARASRIVCVSRSTLLDLHRWSGLDASRCVVIGNTGQRLETATPPPRKEAESPYVLTVGSAYGNKNTSTLLRAFERMNARSESGERGGPPRLVMVGPLSRNAGARLDDEVRRRGISHLVDHRGFVGPAELGALYAGAAALVFPSIYEGQGVPVIEALAYGVPVLATDLPPIREAAPPDLVLIDDPLNPDAWATAILRACDGRRSTVPASAGDRIPTATTVGAAYADLVRELAADDVVSSTPPPDVGVGRGAV